MAAAANNDVPRALAGGAKLRSRAAQKTFERFIMAMLVACATFSVFVTFTIIIVLFGEAIRFFQMPIEQLQMDATPYEAATVTFLGKSGNAEDTLGELRYKEKGAGFAGGKVARLDAGDGDSPLVYAFNGADSAIKFDAPAKDVSFSLSAAAAGDPVQVTAFDDQKQQVAQETVRPSETQQVDFGEATLSQLTFTGGAVRDLQFTLEPHTVQVSEFAFGGEWNPLLGKTKHFGIWPLISGTLLVTLVAMLVAIPLGLITAVYLSEYAPRRVRDVIKPTLEILAGVPTVVYGFFALILMTPAIKYVYNNVFVNFFEWLWPAVGLDPTTQGAWLYGFLTKDFSGYNAFSAGLAVGILCLPTISSLTEDALRAVPRGLREGGFGLGGTKFDVTLKVVLPAALSGIISAILLALARAVGETMIVSLAGGNLARLTLDPRSEIQTMTAWLVQMALGDVSNFGVEYLSMYAVAAVLFVMTLTLTIIGQLVRMRFREVYQ